MKSEDAKRAVTEIGLQVIAGAAATLIDAARDGEEAAVGSALENFKNGVTHARACEQAMYDVIDHLFGVEERTPSLSSEGDEAYRERLRRVVGGESVHTDRLEKATGAGLDVIGGFYSTKRK